MELDIPELVIDLDQKCDILISEILDTVLLGEGVLVAVRDAKVNDDEMRMK